MVLRKVFTMNNKRITNSKNIEIGIPRAMSYYNNYPFYYGFFSALGYNIVLSDKTTTALINNGVECVVSDTCLPIKVFTGHVLNLIEKGCNTIFVPSLQSVGFKINNCSKIRGLPEIIRNVIGHKINLIEPTLDKTEGIGITDFCYDIANQLNISDENLVKAAISAGWSVYNRFTEMAKSGVPYTEAITKAINGKYVQPDIETVKPVSVVIMAHGYNLFDERVSLNLIKKLEKMDVKVYTSLNVSRNAAIESIHKLGEIQYWANELDLTGTAAYYILNKKTDGIVALSAFGCGPDSLMIDEIQYHASNRGIPLLHLTIDEHTGEAGFVTRLEAFIDMLLRRKRKMLEKQADNINLLPANNLNVKNKLNEKILTDSSV